MDQAASSRAGRRQVLVEQLEPRVFFSTGELIRNGSLEGVVASADWVRSGLFQADSRFTNLHSGLGYAYLSNTDGSAGNSISGSMYQAVTIPAAATELKLSFWTKITTSETTTSAQNDPLSIQITNAAGTSVLQSVATLSNLNASTGYVKRTYTLSNSLKGQSVRVLFTGSTNASLPTTFRVDDVGLSTQTPDTLKKISAYLPQYRFSSFSKIDLNLVTHINYFSVSVGATGALTTSGVNDGNLATVVAAAHAKGVGVSITVGPQSFGTVAADATARATFATNIVNYCTARNLDGIDIDWEPPATGTNYANYALLLQAIYDKSSPLGLKLTAAVNPWTQEIPVAATNLMDWVNVMCYDFHYANNSTYEASIDGMIQWSDYGVEKHKLLMGIPFYGRSGTSWSDTTSKTYGTFFTEYSALHGAPPAPEVDSFVDANGKQWYVNGVRTIQKKMAWTRDNGYGGAMIWELGQDHWDAASKYDQYSLLPVLNSMLRPPAWLSPAAGSMFNYVNNTLSLASGSVTFIGDAYASNSKLSLSIGAGSSASFNLSQRFSGLSITSGGQLDLKTNDLVLDYSGASPMSTWNGSVYTGISGLIQSGQNGGSWNGSGLITSNTAAQTGLTTLAIGEAFDLLGINGSQTAQWNGRTVDATTVLVKYTYAGDANLDGMIDGSDYGHIDFNVAMPGAFAYFNGDFNYDGAIDGSDYGPIDFNIAAQGAAL